MEKPSLICFGLGGHTLYYRNNRTLQGYLRPNDVSVEEAKEWEDCPVLDIRGALNTEAGRKWVLIGPMVNPDLPPGECTRLQVGPVTPLEHILLEDSENPIGKLYRLHLACTLTNSKPGPLDRVSVEEYIQGWRKVGAKSGRVVGGRIVWDKAGN